MAVVNYFQNHWQYDIVRNARKNKLSWNFSQLKLNKGKISMLGYFNIHYLWIWMFEKFRRKYAFSGKNRTCIVLGTTINLAFNHREFPVEESSINDFHQTLSLIFLDLSFLILYPNVNNENICSPTGIEPACYEELPLIDLSYLLGFHNIM